MATTATRTEYRNTRAVARILVSDSTGANWDGDTIIISDCAGKTVTFTGDGDDSSASKIDNDNYEFGTNGLSNSNDIAAAIGNAIKLADANGDLAVKVDGTADHLVYLTQLVTPQVFNQGGWKDIGGTAETNEECIIKSFALGFRSEGGHWATRDKLEFPNDDLYIKPHVVVSQDFTLHHYDLDHVDANFNITSTTNDNPRQAPFSKRFQLVRSTTGDTTTLG
jgi:hypothetical protein